LIGALYAWRGDTFDLNLNPLAIAHLSAMLAVVALVLAASMWLGRYDLLFAHNTSIVFGAAYTDVYARLPLYTFQAGASVVLGGALFANMWLRKLRVPLIGAGLWVLMLIIGQIYPAALQTFFVTPSAQSYELPYITREIAGTRAAYGRVQRFSQQLHRRPAREQAGRPERPGHHRQPQAVGLRAPQGHLRAAADHSHLLQLQRHRHRPLQRLQDYGRVAFVYIAGD